MRNPSASNGSTLVFRRDMIEELPEIEDFTSSVAQLHQSVASSNGKYGFPVTTYMGPLPQDNRWCDTWEEFFVQGMKRMLELESNAQGPKRGIGRACRTAII